MPTKQQLEDLQKASLFEKIILTKQRIREWVSQYAYTILEVIYDR